MRDGSSWGQGDCSEDCENQILDWMWATPAQKESRITPWFLTSATRMVLWSLEKRTLKKAKILGGTPGVQI